jgi:hypothetical protein
VNPFRPLSSLAAAAAAWRRLAARA